MKTRSKMEIESSSIPNESEQNQQTTTRMCPKIESSSLPNESEQHQKKKTTTTKKCQKKKNSEFTYVKKNLYTFSGHSATELSLWKKAEFKRLVDEHKARVKELEPFVAERKRLNFKKSEKQYITHGYIFKPTEELLVDYYLRKKSLDEPMDFHPIEEVDVYATHPQSLIEKYQDSGEKVWYFFSQSRPNEVEETTGGSQGHWIFGEKNDVLNSQGEKIGVKQVVDYFEGSNSGNSEFKIIEYKLDPAAASNSHTNGVWYICMLSNGAV